MTKDELDAQIVEKKFAKLDDELKKMLYTFSDAAPLNVADGSTYGQSGKLQVLIDMGLLKKGVKGDTWQAYILTKFGGMVKKKMDK